MQTDIIINGLSGAAILVALVFVLRRAFAWSRRATVLWTLGGGQVLAVGTWAAGRWPEFSPLWLAIISGVAISLMASGGWSSSKAVVEDQRGTEKITIPPG